MARLSASAPSASKLRSELTNDPFRLRGVDMGSAAGRRFRDLVSDLAAELGGIANLSTIDIALVRQAAMDIIRAEDMQGEAMRGHTVIDHTEITRISNSARSALTKLREKRPRHDPVPSLDSYLDDAAEAAS